MIGIHPSHSTASLLPSESRVSRSDSLELLETHLLSVGFCFDAIHFFKTVPWLAFKPSLYSHSIRVAWEASGWPSILAVLVLSLYQSCVQVHDWVQTDSQCLHLPWLITNRATHTSALKSTRGDALYFIVSDSLPVHDSCQTSRTANNQSSTLTSSFLYLQI